MLDDQITVLIPTSPIPRHPSTDLIEECIAGIRGYFPVAKLFIMADGVRPQIEHRRGQYDEYLKRLSGKVNSLALGRTELLLFDEPWQQAEMTKRTLEKVTTPLILFVEHDAVLRSEAKIVFPDIFDLLLSGEVNLVRFYLWQDVWWEHQYLMRGEFTHGSSRFVKTVQYSQWPLVSRTDYHRKILNEYFVPFERKMIETKMYGPVASSQWEEHKLVIYFNGEFTFDHYDGRTDRVTSKRDVAEW